MTRYTTFIPNEMRLDLKNLTSFPAIGISTKTYLAIDTGKLYRYDTNTSSYIEISQDTTDLTPYQNKSEKDQASGYLGLDAYERVNSYKNLFPINKVGWNVDFLVTNDAINWITSSSSAGGGSLINNGANTLKVKNGNNTALYLPVLKLNASTTGSVSIIIGNNGQVVYSPYFVYSEVVLSIQNTTSFQHSTTIFLGNASSFPNNGNGLFITHDPTQNSGLVRVGKVVAGTTTYVNKSTAIISEEITSFAIKYNKNLEEAYFYINNTLIHTLTSVNIANTVIMFQKVFKETSVTSDTNIKYLGVIGSVYEVNLA